MSLRAKRSNPSGGKKESWIASRSLSSGGAFAPTRWLAMTIKNRRPPDIIVCEGG
jgi:hypothetical protein